MSVDLKTTRNAADKHGTPDGVRTSALPWSINIAPLTGCRSSDNVGWLF